MTKPAASQTFNQTADSQPQLLLTYNRRLGKQRWLRLSEYMLEPLPAEQEQLLREVAQRLREIGRDFPVLRIAAPPKSVSRPSVLSWADSMVLVHAPDQPGELVVRLLKERRVSDLQQGLLFELDSYCTFDRD